MQVTAGHLLGGRVAYLQPAEGYRTGIEPVLLAGSVPAVPGERVLEAGLGAGAGLLCLLARVPSLAVTGVELDPAMAELARRNLCAAQATVITGDILFMDRPPVFDHAYANPPWHNPAGTPSPDHGRRTAKQAGADTLRCWIERLAACVRPRGSVTVIVPAARLGDALGAMGGAGCGGRVTVPLWPKAGRDAKLVIVRGVRGSRAPDRIAPGLTLHDADGSYTAPAQAVLAEAAPLIF